MREKYFDKLLRKYEKVKCILSRAYVNNRTQNILDLCEGMRQ